MDPDGRDAFNVFSALLGIAGGLYGSNAFAALFATTLFAMVLPELILMMAVPYGGATAGLYAIYVAVGILSDLYKNAMSVKSATPKALLGEVISFFSGLAGFYGLYLETIQ